MALRKHYKDDYNGCLYLATIPDIQDFMDLDVKAMMESKLPSLGYVGRPIPAVYCPGGDLDMDILKMLTEVVTNEKNPQTLVAKSFDSNSEEYMKQKISQTRNAKGRTSPKSCDDIFWTK